MSPVSRSIAGVVAGVVAHGVTVFLVEMVGHAVYPPPVGLMTMSPEEFRAAIAGMPTGALLFVLAAWATGPLVGGFLAAVIAGRAPFLHAGIVGVFALLASVVNLMLIPHPAWFGLAAAPAVIGANLAGAWLAQSLLKPGLDTRGTPTLTPAAGTPPEGGASAGAA